MSVDICGFIEVSYLDSASEDDAWLMCVDIGTIGLPAHDTCEVLFGEGRWPDTPTVWPGIAHRRGLPATMGHHTRQEAEKALEWQQRVHGIWGFTHLDYEEIRRINWADYPADAHPNVYGSRAWGLLFKLLETLAANFPCVRLIVWFEHIY